LEDFEIALREATMEGVTDPELIAQAYVGLTWTYDTVADVEFESIVR
jgi:hypothetical protein